MRVFFKKSKIPIDIRQIKIEVKQLPGCSQKTVIVKSTHGPGPKIPMRDDFATAATFVTLLRIYESIYKEDGLDYRINIVKPFIPEELGRTAHYGT
ncbi:hypothetical protein SFRURICE_011839 [Spodoptera frugiperda]|nr:hypothetical protein SFRURICE_011839 [Spodoptera frugiperda]